MFQSKIQTEKLSRWSVCKNQTSDSHLIRVRRIILAQQHNKINKNYHYSQLANYLGLWYQKRHNNIAIS